MSGKFENTASQVTLPPDAAEDLIDLNLNTGVATDVTLNSPLGPTTATAITESNPLVNLATQTGSVLDELTRPLADPSTKATTEKAPEISEVQSNSPELRTPHGELSFTPLNQIDPAPEAEVDRLAFRIEEILSQNPQSFAGRQEIGALRRTIGEMPEELRAKLLSILET